jgi:hypothetical protein
MNNRKWTDMQFQASERIECSLIINVDEQINEKKFGGQIQVQVRRAVYNSNYNSTLFNFKDDNFNFEYIDHMQLEYVDGTFSSNLTAILAYYAYIIIGYDCDSYSKLGGSPYFTKAESIANQAQSQSEKGWKAFEDNKNRYALISNLMDENLKKFREFFYIYHRLGLDEMASNADKGSAAIAEAFDVLKEANRARPSNIALFSFIDTKRDEIVNIFSKAPTREKMKVYEILVDVDPAQTSKYEPMIKN